MNYAIIGFGKEGQALAKLFARKGLEVAIASRRSTEELAPLAKTIGPTIIPKSLQDAVEADVIFLAMPFGTQKEIAKAAKTWTGKIVIDVTNSYGVSPEDFGNLPSSVVIAQAFPDAKVVKAFNHLPAATLAEDQSVDGMRRVIFLAGDDSQAVAQTEALAQELGFAPVKLGTLAEGSLLIQARGKTWAPLIFQDLFKKKA